MLSILFGVRAVSFMLIMVTPTIAQTQITPRLFQWAFQNTALSTELPTCSPIPIVVKSYNPNMNGVPPYYMISFAVGVDGTAVTSLIGSDENNLLWTITQPVGSQLLLSVVDSLGNPGGIPPQLITVIPGQTTQCVSTPLNNPSFTISANVSGDIETCAPWGITVSGGSPPYTITLAETNSPVVTNVSIPLGADRFTYINRADLGGQLIAAVSDLEGRWAVGVPMVKPVGSNDTSCTGLVSSSGNNTEINEQDAEINTAAAIARHKRTIETALGLVVLFFLLGACGWLGLRLWLRRRRQTRKQRTIPTQFPPLGQEQPEPEPVPEPGRWQVRSDAKRSRDVEAPPYREYDPAPVTFASGSGSRAATVDSFSPGPSSRPQLLKLRMSPPPPKVREKPVRYLDSATIVVSAGGPDSSSSPEESARRISPGDRSRLVAFPVTSIRKNSVAGGATGEAVSRSASALATSSLSTAPARVSRNKTAAATKAVATNPFEGGKPMVIEEEEEILDYMRYYYKDSGRQGPQATPPRY